MNWIYGSTERDNWLMPSFTCIVQEYLSRSRRKLCAFYFLDQSCVLQTFFAKQLKLYHMEINILMYTVRLEHKSFRPIFGLLLSTTVDIVSLFFTHAKFLHQHKYNFEVLIVTLSVFQHWPFLWQWGQYARKLPHFIYQQCPCDYSEDYILIN